MRPDLVIRNGTVIDGSGRAAFRADVAVQGSRIAEIGRVSERGTQEIDAEGHVVTPGFIDGHTHMDAQLFWDPTGASSCWHGVTSVVMGNCGFTVAPVRRGEEGYVTRNLERAEDIPAEALRAGLPWDWETFGEYLDAVDRAPKAINYAANVGHSALRTWAMGERAFDQQADDDDVALLCQGLRAALDAGALGFTTSRAPAHSTSDDRPVASRLASWAEVEALARVLAASSGGPLELAQEPVLRPEDDPAARNDFFDRLRRLAVDVGVTVTFGLPPLVVDEQLALLDSTAAQGGRMFGQSHSRGIAVVLSFLTNLPFDYLPEWQPVRSLPYADQLAALRDPAVRRRLTVAAGDETRYRAAVGGEPRPPRYDIMTVLDDPVRPNTTIAALAAERRMHPVEVIIDLAVTSELRQLFVQPLHAASQDDLLRIMRHPQAVMSFSDSGAHVGQIIDASIYSYLFAYWVRQKEAFTLEEAVRMVTRAPARAWGFAERGVIREGMVADLNVFHPATFGPRLPTVFSDLPGGGRRLEQRADGVAATIVAGRTVIRDGEHTGDHPGALLRRRGRSLR
jgi:N-acyl-D-amino-acid deacylase